MFVGIFFPSPWWENVGHNEMLITDLQSITDSLKKKEKVSCLRNDYQAILPHFFLSWLTSINNYFTFFLHNARIFFDDAAPSEIAFGSWLHLYGSS